MKQRFEIWIHNKKYLFVCDDPDKYDNKLYIKEDLDVCTIKQMINILINKLALRAYTKETKNENESEETWGLTD